MYHHYYYAGDKNAKKDIEQAKKDAIAKQKSDANARIQAMNKKKSTTRRSYARSATKATRKKKQMDEMRFWPPHVALPQGKVHIEDVLESNPPIFVLSDGRQVRGVIDIEQAKLDAIAQQESDVNARIQALGLGEIADDDVPYAPMIFPRVKVTKKKDNSQAAAKKKPYKSEAEKWNALTKSQKWNHRVRAMQNIVNSNPEGWGWLQGKEEEYLKKVDAERRSSSSTTKKTKKGGNGGGNKKHSSDGGKRKRKQCTNDATRYYDGTEPSPTGLGLCASVLRVGRIETGADGREWIVQKTSNGVRRWVRVTDKNQCKYFRKTKEPRCDDQPHCRWIKGQRPGCQHMDFTNTFADDYFDDEKEESKQGKKEGDEEFDTASESESESESDSGSDSDASSFLGRTLGRAKGLGASLLAPLSPKRS